VSNLLEIHTMVPIPAAFLSFVSKYTLSYTTMVSGIQAFVDQSQKSLKFLVILQEYHNLFLPTES